MAPEIIAKIQTMPEPKTLGIVYPPYQHTYNFTGRYIDKDHNTIADFPVKDGLIKTSIQGFLRPHDALALYEIAFYSGGDVLEMGSAWGLSTSILCKAVCNANQGNKVYSIEINNDFQRITAKTIKSLKLNKFYASLTGDAGAIGNKLIRNGHKFNFAFIDHNHSYDATLTACNHLTELLTPGSFALIHDFNDARNITKPEEYGVYSALNEFIKKAPFSFCGIHGCCALIKKQS